MVLMVQCHPEDLLDLSIQFLHVDLRGQGDQWVLKVQYLRGVQQDLLVQWVLTVQFPQFLHVPRSLLLVQMDQRVLEVRRDQKVPTVPSVLLHHEVQLVLFLLKAR